MKKVAPKIVSITLAAIVLLASSGFSLFIHHCQCEGEIHLSIFNEVGCNYTHTKAHAHYRNVHFVETLKFEEKQTCGCWNEVLKVKTDNFAGPQKVEVSQVFSNYLTKIDSVDLHQPIQKPNYTNKTNWDNPPPNLTGKKICIKHHQLKITHLL